MTRLSSERGQVTVLTAIFLTAMVGMAGFVLDVGGWFRQQRVSQATVDAAALAGAQALPSDPNTAQTLAVQYARANGGAQGATITVGSKYVANDSITVSQAQPASGIFSSIFGVSTATTHATATARVALPTAADGVAPIVVDIHHPMLSGNGCPCFGVPTTIPLGKKGVPGAFGILDLIQNDKGNAGDSQVADWIQNGFNGYLPLGDYDSDPGAKFNSSQVQDALMSKYGSDLLFPVYDSLSGTGSNAPYHIIGWAAFHLTLVQAGGNNGTLSGYFDRVIWDGLIPPDGSSDQSEPNLGVYSTALVN